MFYDGYHIWGMHLIWWCVWLFLIFWIFAVPCRIPGQRYRRDTPEEILGRRLACGEITNDEYQAKKAILDNGRKI